MLAEEPSTFWKLEGNYKVFEIPEVLRTG